MAGEMDLQVREPAGWPGVAPTPELEAAVAAHVTASATHAGVTAATLHANDVFLAVACARGDAAALAAFDAELLKPLAGPLRKLGLDTAKIDETLQIMRDELLVARPDHEPRILDYRGTGRLAGWLRAVATRTALRDHKRAGGPSKQSEYVDNLHGGASADLELAYMKKTYGEAFATAFQAAVAALPVADRLLLKQRFGHQLGVVELGRLYGVNAGTITRRVQAVRDKLVATTRDQMADALRVGQAELASILRLIESQMDVSLSALG